jgi:hypothetical protein
MEMNLPNPKVVLANEAFSKGSPRPDSFSALNRLRHRQAGCKNFRADTFRMVVWSIIGWSVSQMTIRLLGYLTILNDCILKFWKLACLCRSHFFILL